MSDIVWDNLERELQAYGEDIVERYRERLVSRDKIATRELYNSLRPFVKFGGKSAILYLQLASQWKYIEYGTRAKAGMPQGKFPPTKAIERWIEAKPVIPYAGKNGRIPTRQQLAFLIARKIWRYGTQPYHFLAQSLGAPSERDMRIQEAIRKDISNWINSLI